MFKTQETISKLKPLHLLQPNIPGKQIFILITNSEQCFWMQENQRDWEEVMINPDGYSCDRDGGSTTFRFNGKKFNQLYISSPLEQETSHISGDNEFVSLEKLPLSKQKLEEIGIANQVKLDLSNLKTSGGAEQALTKKLDKSGKLTARRLTNPFTNNMDLFFDTVSKDSQQTSDTSESGSSADSRFSN